MISDTNLDNEDVKWLENYKKQVADAYSTAFHNASKRFRDGDKLIVQFEEAFGLVLRDGPSRFHVADENHNELCIAAAILANADHRVEKLEYEPVLQGCAQSIDFRATMEGGQTIYVDVKTIAPEHRDRWEQFEQAQKEGWLPDNVNVFLSNKWLGGEIWHSMFAARSRMLEYTLELEEKIAQAGLHNPDISVILAFCGEGFRWHEDELEDFVSFYRSGAHRPDDPFGRAEDHYIKQKGIALRNTISCFACMRRPLGGISCKRLNWNVQPPSYPGFGIPD